MKRHRLNEFEFGFSRKFKEGTKLINHADKILKAVTKEMDRETRVRLCRHAGRMKLRGFELVNNL